MPPCIAWRHYCLFQGAALTQMSTVLRAAGWCLGLVRRRGGTGCAALSDPARHVVTVGHNDEAYVQGFGEAANRWDVVTDTTGASGPLRWSGPDSALVFPQIGLPARVTLRLRAWRLPNTPPAADPCAAQRSRGTGSVSSRAAIGRSILSPIASGLTKPRDCSWDLPSIRCSNWTASSVACRSSGSSLPQPAGRSARIRRSWSVLASRLCWRHWCYAVQRRILLATGLMCLLFLVAYRLQISPYPLRALWEWLSLFWLGVLFVRGVEQRARPVAARPALIRLPMAWSRLPDLLALACVLIWTPGALARRTGPCGAVTARSRKRLSGLRDALGLPSAARQVST